MFKNAFIIITALLSVSVMAAPSEATADLVEALQRVDARGFSPVDANFAGVKRSCASGYMECSDGGCCRTNGQCCILNACCNPGYYCVRNEQSTRVGCCPDGRVCASP
ncbi:hypothetical protein BV22DRAFT_1034429 [Leucogyrophana mollusca]|uniref:Uncharacterized protein n=1 Tax=Leucogyrophana mollusca TaxID=85980 RepID=A0ACB8BHC3_9AGAM|nr:hypothetical protein BV22DRAFT_1034429 [Leucogyrophana mollusca]